MLSTPVVAASASDRWLLTLSIAALAVLAIGTFARRAARGPDGENRQRGVRRRAGALVAIGPLVGLVLAPSLGDLAIVVAVGAAVLAAVGVAVERLPRPNRLALLATMVGALVAVLAGARFGPTGVPALDAIGAFVLIVLATEATDGLGNIDSLASGIGTIGAAGLFAVAAFAQQDGLAGVLLGLAAACFAFLAFNGRPASLFIGRGGRLAIGFTLGVGALAVDPAAGAWRSLLTPLIVLGVLLLDIGMVALDRIRRRHPLGVHRPDHLVHRLAKLGWQTGEAVAIVLIAQLVLVVVAIFTARAVMPEWLGAAIALLVVLVLGIEAGRARMEHDPAPGLTGRAWAVVGVVVVALVLAVLPTALSAKRAADLMIEGKDSASRGLAAARDGDTITAQGAFNEAAREFARARDKLESPMLSPGLAVPGVASNLRAARALAGIGTDLANAGESLTVAVRPESLEVVGGRLPLDVVRSITPKLEAGSVALSRALDRLDRIRDDPYLAPPVRDAIDKIHKQLVQSEGEARRAAAAAELAPALFGGDGARRYLLVVQNNAEARATGGFIGSFGIMTAVDGKLHVDPLERTSAWNAATRATGTPTIDAPADYLRRYSTFKPESTLQNVNMSPDFPSVGQVLMSQTEQAGLGKVDGVMAVDPEGLAALLELSGPVTVDGWDTPIDAANVVDVTLRDAYARFAETPERADFLGDVAQAAVAQATSGTLGKPAQIAKILGGAAHAGHLTLAFARPEEQRLAEQLDVAQKVVPIRSDAVAVTTSNAGGNKLDYYLHRDVDYRVMLHPSSNLDAARASADLTVKLDNTAPDSGLPSIVIGPYDNRFVAGENRTYLSLYSGLGFRQITVDDKPTGVASGRERGRNVYSLVQNIMSRTTKRTSAKLSGEVALHDGWYDVVVRQQPSINPDLVHVSVDVPDGWRIDKAPGMDRPFSRRASVSTSLEKTTTYRVHIVPDRGTWDLWQRLQDGS
jgi:UDP-N-acetylmuramyl pentapeptide phosphotransferase/UDP-N-acetylglucosamine-1-phosphate transferase